MMPPPGVGCDRWPPEPGDVITIVSPAGTVRYLVTHVCGTSYGGALTLLRDPEDEDGPWLWSEEVR